MHTNTDGLVEQWLLDARKNREVADQAEAMGEVLIAAEMRQRARCAESYAKELSAALSSRQGEAVAEVYAGAFGIHYIACALRYLMQQFDAETWECKCCGHSETCADMDSADYLRRYLATPAAQPEQLPVERAYDLGWHAAARWAERDDLHADVDSPAYAKERDAALAPHAAA